MLESNSYYTILRDGKEVNIPIPNNLVERLSDKKNNNKGFIAPQIPFLVGDVKSNSPADKAGLQEGDKIVEINGKSIQFYHELIEYRDQQEDKPSTLKIQRGNEELSLKITPSEDGTFGFYHNSLLRSETIEYSILASVTKGTRDAFGSVVNNIKGFGKIFRGEVSLEICKWANQNL